MLALNERSYLQASWMQSVPAMGGYPDLDWPVLQRGLAPPLLWLHHPVTQMLQVCESPPAITAAFPALRHYPISLLPPAIKDFGERIGLFYNSATIAGARERWRLALRECRADLERNGWAVIRGVIPQPMALAYRRYFAKIRPFIASGDGQVAKRLVRHNDGLCRMLHLEVARMFRAEGAFPEDLIPSYCYLGIYHSAAVLERHTDRPQCRWNMSIVLDSDPPVERAEDGWPINLEIDGEVNSACAAIGDAIMYRGDQIPHWRDAMPERFKYMSICFFHFVQADFAGDLR